MPKTALLLTLPFSLCLSQPLYAQSITAAPDGTGTIIQHQGNTYHIQGGTQTGANLFHSFQEFGLSSGAIANFLSDPSIVNILGRVTGGNASMIDGLIQANPNLYLMNPAGIIFGENASLNVGGDFFATTADQICFEENCFNSVGVSDYETLLGSPTSWGFLQAQPGGLVNAGTLKVRKDKSINLSGGTVVNLGQIEAPGGIVTVAAIPGEHRVLLNQPGQLLSLEMTDSVLVDGIKPLALPELLTGTSITQPSPAVEEGDVVIAGTIEAAQVDLYAAGQVKPTDVDLVQGKTTVVRFPEAAGTTILNIIDAHADNAQDLLFGGAAGTIATLVQDDENGIGAISETLSRIDQPLDGMSITAEGNVGSFWLGNTLITHESLQNYLGQLAQWSSAFKASADLLLYSCFTALGATGEALMASLAAETGLNVAASTNVTGSANHGGDWILESRTGSIETQTPFTDETLANWDGALATLTVDSNLDNTTANTVVTLREAIAAANVGGTTTDRGDISVTGADEIRFNGVTLVTLNAGQLVISEELTITGGGTNVTIERDASASDFRIFGVSANVPTTFEDVTISGGKIGGVGGGIRSSGDVTLINSTVSGNSSGSQGGGIFSNREVTLTNSTVSGNSAGGEGGGIISFATAVSLTNSTVSGNSSNSAGGGIASIGAVTLTNSSVSNNSANTDAGGILNFDVLTLTNSTVSGNSAGNIGGGMRSNADAILTNSTIANNSAGNHGGGIFGNGAVTLTNSTIAFNEAGGNSGGIYARNPSSLNNTIVSNNSAVGTGSDLSGTFTVNSSLILNPNGATIAGSNNIFGQDPLLQALANNGGFTLTHGLQGGSPALNAGDNTLTASTTDQRGATRISGIVDIGAVESQLTLSATAGNNQSTTVDTLFGTDLAVTLQNEFGGTAPGAGISITFTPATLGASGTFSGGNTVITNASGTATANPLQANTIIGNHTVAASLDGSNVNFNLTNTVGDAANVTIVNGNNQSAITNQTFNESLKVLITDDFGNPIANQTVTFAVPTAGASAILNQNSVTTDSNGFATVGLTANGNVGSYVILVNVDGTDGNTISLTNDLDIDALQYLVDRDQDPIDSLTNACQTVPAVKLELPSVERDDLGLDEMIELNEQCLPVAKN